MKNLLLLSAVAALFNTNVFAEMRSDFLDAQNTEVSFDIDNDGKEDTLSLMANGSISVKTSLNGLVIESQEFPADAAFRVVKNEEGESKLTAEYMNLMPNIGSTRSAYVFAFDAEMGDFKLETQTFFNSGTLGTGSVTTYDFSVPAAPTYTVTCDQEPLSDFDGLFEIQICEASDSVVKDIASDTEALLLSDKNLDQTLRQVEFIK